MIRRGLNFVLRDLRDTLGSNPAAILTGFGVILIALLAVVAVTLLAENAAQSRRNELADEVEPFANDLALLEANLLTLSTDVRGFVLTGDPMFRQRYLSDRSAVASQLGEVEISGERAGFGTPAQAVVQEAVAYNTGAEAAFAATERGDAAEAERLIAGENTVRLDAATAAIASVQVTLRERSVSLRNRIDEIDTVERYFLFLCGTSGNYRRRGPGLAGAHEPAPPPHGARGGGALHLDNDVAFASRYLPAELARHHRILQPCRRGDVGL